ncbi:MAG: class I SAM-dependent methyltransferase [Deltaproteobacteria bacterium]|nr:class I SAM-dependent methyltransferase [Deltaproteobacteria bacterium]
MVGTARNMRGDNIEAFVVQSTDHRVSVPTNWARAMCAECLEECFQGKNWHSISSDMSPNLEQILERSGADYLLFLLNDQVILNPSALRGMLEALNNQKGYGAIGPVSLQAINPAQKGGPSKLFHNRRNYYRIAEEFLIKEGNAVRLSERLDSFCILCSRTVLKSLSPNTPVTELGSALASQNVPLLVACGAFVYRFADMYDHEREDLIALVPENAKTILDIGCSRGAMGKRIKGLRECRITGIETDPVLAAGARECLDEVIPGSIENTVPMGPFDCIVCGDVLEHLADPWGTLKDLKSILSRDGVIVASVPNVQHWSIVKDLLEGNWEYIPAGLLCSGHLRFFTRGSLVRMFREAGFLRNELFAQMETPSQEGETFIKRVSGLAGISVEDMKTLAFRIRAGN